jgi:AraC-like DNA-binding protein
MGNLAPAAAADPTLTPAMIAAAHHVSVRYLYRLFETEQSRVAAWIRQRRLERCPRDLLDPALRTQPVSAIAGRWGSPSRHTSAGHAGLINNHALTAMPTGIFPARQATVRCAVMRSTTAALRAGSWNAPPGQSGLVLSLG